MNAPWRPALRYAGSKWRIADDVLAHLPSHLHYVEPYGGGAAILLRKARSLGEVYNDLDGEVVNFFRVLRDPEQAARLCELIALTPFAREEFEAAYEPTSDPIERARRLTIRCNMGHGAMAIAKATRTGFRAHSVKREKSYSEDWARYPQALRAVVDRLRGVVIENRPALQVMQRFDSRKTLIYADPPYVHATRSERVGARGREHAYACEMTDEDHIELLAWLEICESMVALSGYRSDLYDARLKGWTRIDIPARGPRNAPRVECLWLNPAAVAANRGLFDL